MTTKHARLTVTAVALLAFAFGCATEALVVPPVRAGTNPTRWEYACFEHDNPVESANKLGAAGWELVAVATHGQGIDAVDRWCFKRPLP